MLRAVLFDLDGTLLDIDLNAFFRAYFAELAPVLAEILGDASRADAGLDAVLEGTNAMTMPHPGATNRDVFEARFLELTGVNIAADPHAATLTRFYAERFPALRGAMGPLPGAREAVTTALELGLKVAIATNPIFPRAAIQERMRWAEVDDLPVHVVTSYENVHAAKPQPGYFAEVASMLGVAPKEAMMVGDDRVLDMVAADVGMKTYYVGSGMVPGTDWAGDLGQLTELLPRLV